MIPRCCPFASAAAAAVTAVARPRSHCASRKARDLFACFTFVAALGMAQVSPNGDQFQVNSYTTFQQNWPDVAADDLGNFVVVWQSYGSPGGDQQEFSIQGQRFAASGAARGVQFQVNTHAPGSQYLPHVASASASSFVVVWQSQTSSGSDQDLASIQARLFDADGVPLAPQFQVNSYTTGYQSQADAAIAETGDFVVVWFSRGSYGNDSSHGSIQGRRYSATGSELGPQFQVNFETTSEQSAPAVAAVPGGGFVVTWQSDTSNGGDVNAQSIQAQRFAPDGQPVGEQFQVNSYVTGAQTRPDIAVDGSGRFVVAWESYGSSGSDTSGWSIHAQRFSAAGAMLGSEFQVNTFTTSDQRYPAATSDAAGRFVIAWQSSGSGGVDDSLESVQARRFAANGTALSGEFQVNTYSTGGQIGASVVASPLGDFVVTWQSYGSPANDQSTFSIQGQRFDGLFRDGFEAGNTSRWSTPAP